LHDDRGRVDRADRAGHPARSDQPDGLTFAIDATGVTVTYDGKTELIPLRT